MKLRIVKEEPDKSFIKREISYTHGSSQTRKVYQFQVFFKCCMITVMSTLLFTRDDSSQRLNRDGIGITVISELPFNHKNIQMVNWPDHGVPKNGDHVFELIEKFRQQQSVVQNPK